MKWGNTLGLNSWWFLRDLERLLTLPYITEPKRLLWNVAKARNDEFPKSTGSQSILCWEWLAWNSVLEKFPVNILKPSSTNSCNPTSITYPPTVGPQWTDWIDPMLYISMIFHNPYISLPSTGMPSIVQAGCCRRSFWLCQLRRVPAQYGAVGQPAWVLHLLRPMKVVEKWRTEGVEDKFPTQTCHLGFFPAVKSTIGFHHWNTWLSIRIVFQSFSLLRCQNPPFYGSISKILQSTICVLKETTHFSHLLVSGI